MPNLIIMHDQTGATGKDIIELPDNITPTDALIKHFSQGINPDAVQIYLGTKRLVLPSESGNPSKELLEPLKNNLVVVMEAKSAEVLIAAAIVSAIVAVALAPDIPGDAGVQKESPNNKLQGQNNIARPYQAYPLIFGSPTSYPDLSGEPIIEYVDNRKLVRQFMPVGIGTFDIEQTRSGATPIENFTGQDYTYYQPVNGMGTVPEVISVFSTNEVDGQELLGADEPTVIASYELSKNGSNGNVSYTGDVFIFEVLKDIESDALKSNIDSYDPTLYFFLRVNYLYDEFSSPGSPLSEEDGTGAVDSMVLDGGGLFYTITLAEFNGEKSDTDIYDFDTPFDSDQVIDSQIGPFKIAVESNEFWLNFTFPRGLKATVELTVLFTKLDGPNGNPIVGPSPDFYQLTYSGNKLDPQYRTYKQALIQSSGYYQITLERTNNTTNDSARPDTTVLEAIYAVNRQTNVEYGDITVLDMTIPATVNATSLRENQVNITLTSELITYENGAINYTPQPSRYFADALLHMYVVFYGLDPATLALNELYEIQDRLIAIDPRLAYFDFTFDDMDVSLDERMDAILQVARCYKWLDGNVYRFGRDEKRDFEATTITRRDIINEEERDYSLSYNPQLIQNFDSVKIEYVDRTTNKKAYIFRSLDNNGDIVDVAGQNPKSIELAGCSEEYNAINRAELEIRKLAYQRYSLTDTMLPSAMFLDRGDMVLYAEQYNIGGDVFDGEILAVNGNVATTSEHLDFIDGDQYVVHYTTDDGSSAGPFDVTAVSGQPFQFQCDDLLNAFVRDSQLGYKVQTGSRYIISTVEELEASRWSIVGKEARGRNVQLTMVNYNDEIYEFDEI